MIEITRLAKIGGPLTKRISLGGDGKIISDGSACVMARGRAYRLRLGGLDALADVIAEIAVDEAISLGALRPDLPDRVDIAAQDRINGVARPDLVARIASNIIFRPGEPGLALLDFDGKGMPSDVARRIDIAGGFWPALVAALPALADIGHVERASTSAGLYRRDTMTDVPGSDGRHLYICVRDGADVGRFLRALHDRCWLAGYGWLMVGAAGQLLERSIVDFTVGSPERLVFEGPPVLEPPLAQDVALREPLVTEGATLDTASACPALTIVEMARKRELRVREELRLADAVAAARSARIRELVKGGMSPERAHQVVEQQCEKGFLYPDAVLVFDHHGEATVGAVLDDPERFLGETLADPLEGIDYGRGKAKVLRRADGTLVIHSFAHGRKVYELRADGGWVRKKLEAAADGGLVELLARHAGGLDPIEIEVLIQYVHKRTKIGLREIRPTIKAARQAAHEKRQGAERAERAASRTDPRPRIPAPLPDAPWLPVIGTMNEVLGSAARDEPPMRNFKGFTCRIRVRPVARAHAFTSAGANDEEKAQARLPPPEQPLLAQMSLIETAEMIEEFVDHFAGDRSVHLGSEFVKHFHQRFDCALPTVGAVVTLPVALGDGELLSGRGLDRDRGIVFRIPEEVLRVVPEAADCSAQAVGKAMRLLCETWLCDVATDFVGKAIAVAAALTVIERTMLPERPVWTVTGGRRGVGKTTLLSMIIMAVMGVRPSAAAWSFSEEERRKALMAYLLSGIPAIVWDNIKRGVEFKCPHIEKACTAASYSDRKLGETEILDAPAHTIMFFTGNNIRADGDLSSRNLTIRLDTDRADPENREVKHTDPIGWTEANRGEILRALYTVLLGNPRNSEPETRFKGWWHLVGSAVEHAAAQMGEALRFPGHICQPGGGGQRDGRAVRRDQGDGLPMAAGVRSRRRRGSLR
jgi:hypothetical protein